MKNNNSKFIIGCCLIILFTLISSDKISSFLANIVSQNFAIHKLKGNEYTKDYNFKFFTVSENHIPLSYKELIGNLTNSVYESEKKQIQSRQMRHSHSDRFVGEIFGLCQRFSNCHSINVKCFYHQASVRYTPAHDEIQGR